MIGYQTTRELNAVRAKYRGQIIPQPALTIMDAETARLAASDLAAHALKVGNAAPDFPKKLRLVQGQVICPVITNI